MIYGEYVPVLVGRHKRHKVYEICGVDAFAVLVHNVQNTVHHLLRFNNISLSITTSGIVKVGPKFRKKKH